MMRNTLTGISNYDAENKAFDYQGHHVKFDGHYLTITLPDGSETIRQHMSWQAPPRTNDLETIDIAKHIVWDLIEENLPSDWTKRMELERQMEELSCAEHHHDHFVAAYKFRDHIIKVHYDDYPECPWGNWDAEPTALTRNRGDWVKAYGKNDIRIADPYNNIDEETAMRYIGIMLRGIAVPFWTQSESYIAMWTGEEVEEHFSGDYHMALRSLKNSIKTFKAWADGSVYGYMVETPDGHGDIVDSCWGFYGDDYGYMLESAMEYVNVNADRLEREEREANEEIASMIESELGYRLEVAA